MYDHFFYIIHIIDYCWSGSYFLRGAKMVIIGVINSLYPHLVHILETTFTNLNKVIFSKELKVEWGLLILNLVCHSNYSVIP